VLPVQPAVMVLGGLGMLVGIFILPLGQAIAYLAWPFVVYTIRMVEWLAQIPGGAVALGQTSLAWVGLYYLLLFGASVAFRTIPTDRLKQWAGAIRPSLILFGLLVVNVLVWRAVLGAPDGRLHVTLLDANTASLSGEALLIQSPEGRFVLVGGGPSASALSDALGRRLPLYHRTLDALVVANPADEQVAALPRIIERFPPGQVLWVGGSQASSQARYLQIALNEAGIAPVTAESGQVLDLGQGASLKVLDVNRRGAVLFLEWHSFRLLLPVGMDVDSLPRVRREAGIVPVTAYLLANSGEATLNPPEWIEKLHPQVVLLSVAPGDREGLPSPETFEALQGYNLLRTDRNGWIELSTDGKKMWVEVERK
jgi:competence protein ComEC